MEKWEEFKNNTDFRHPDTWICFLFLFFFLIWSVYIEIFTNWSLPLLSQSFYHLCIGTTASALERPTAGKLASYSKPVALQRMLLHPTVFFHYFSFLHCSAKVLVPKLQPPGILISLKSHRQCTWAALHPDKSSTVLFESSLLEHFGKAPAGIGPTAQQHLRRPVSPNCIRSNEEEIQQGLLWVSLATQGALSELYEALLVLYERITRSTSCQHSFQQAVQLPAAVWHRKLGDPIRSPATS